MNNLKIFILVFCIVIIIILIFVVPICVIYKTNKIENFENNSSLKIFKAPMSLTRLTNSSLSSTNEPTNEPTNKTIEPLEQVLSRIEKSRKEIDGNILDFPSFFHCSEKWTGCLPRPLYQGSCGSCWGFASVTALSSRFYIESCGFAGCNNYPQINFGSINNVNYNINEIYKFKKLFLTDAFENMDINKDGFLTLDEWLSVIQDYYNTFNSQASPYIDRHYIAQILVYALNFQSLGSIDLTNKSAVEDRAKQSFDIWISLIEKNELIKNSLNNDINETNETKTSIPLQKSLAISKLKDFWLNEPITLSAEKIISCCNTCMELDYNDSSSKENNPVCMGSSLDEAWSMLRESGTTTADCIGYNLDSWTEGSYSPSCKEVQGPTYSFCSGYTVDKSNLQLGSSNGEMNVNWSSEINKLLNKYENSTISPIAIPSTEKNIPWIDPQLFRFRAKNVYKVKNNVKSIQREILERGPVTTGFDMYPDFQYSFGLTGGSSYKNNKNNINKNNINKDNLNKNNINDSPLGSSKDSLIYYWNGKDKPIGGHAVVIVGWGLYSYTDANKKTYDIPYWICLNSWGYLWGTSGLSNYSNRKGLPNDMTCGGYFWIIRGLNMCGIEDNVIVGQPDIYNISYPDVPTKYGWGLPNPSLEDVTFIKQKTDIIELGSNNFLKYDKPIDGGGSFTDKVTKNNETTWLIESMDPPSPFVLFWDSPRPIYCIGTTLNKLSELSTDNIIEVSNDTENIIKQITSVQTNPLLVIDDEQIQFISFVGQRRLKVLRGVNNSYLSRHSIGANIKIFPYKNLATPDLDRIAKKCSTVLTVE
jgi:hypothetical protein